jgi:poly-gamma-glutamate synthesis protein (capsule biosynthesis protein)
VSGVRVLEPEGGIRLSLAAIGDVGAIGRARSRAVRSGYDALLAAAAPALRDADLGFANLEMPLGEAGQVRRGRAPEFRSDAALLPALARAGVRVVSLANNHVMDCGATGLERTLAACEGAGLACAGAGADLAAARRPAELVVGARRVVVLAYAAPTRESARPDAPGPAPLVPALVEEDLGRWRPRADVLVVSVHWGSMYVDYPPPRVLEIAGLLERGGADLVLGHHPHVPQGWRRTGRCLTLFSLGDAVFDAGAGDFTARAGAAERRESAVFTALVADAPGLDVTPLRLDDDGWPQVPDQATARAQVERLRRLAAGLADAPGRFAREGAPRLLAYEMQSLGHYLKQGRWDRVAHLIGSVRPRHLPLLWQALRAGRRRRESAIDGTTTTEPRKDGGS